MKIARLLLLWFQNKIEQCYEDEPLCVYLRLRLAADVGNTCTETVALHRLRRNTFLGMDLGQDIYQIFFYKFKLSTSAAVTGRNINDGWGEGSTTESTEDRGRTFEVDDHLLKAIIENDLLKTTREVAEELGVNNSTVVRHLGKKLEE
ncbi:hypothetical protein RB195_025507 [Necator americanus]|uniref:Mos1 transposase HTH domain-containing protein n=1 Tax=Necator americanus TaxID=51031 RepID=A0ABR1EST0_NECAM